MTSAFGIIHKASKNELIANANLLRHKFKTPMTLRGEDAQEAQNIMAQKHATKMRHVKKLKPVRDRDMTGFSPYDKARRT